MNNKQSIALKTTIERPQNIGCGHASGGHHIFLASGFHFHINNQMDAGDPDRYRESHIGVGADMDQVIEILINSKPHDQRGLSTFQQPHNTRLKMN